MTRLLVLCPLAEEAVGVVARLAGREAARSEHAALAWKGRLAGRDVLVCVTGDGPARAGAAARAAALRGRAFVVAGVAGALARDLRPGDLVAATAAYDQASGARADAPRADVVAVASGGRAAPVLTALRVAASPEERARLAAAWTPPPAAVDLETWPLVAAAATAGLPWAVLRAVSDAAEEELPPYLEASRRGDGSLDRGAVARAALARPWTLPTLARLRRRLARCSSLLADACEGLAASGWPEGPPG